MRPREPCNVIPGLIFNLRPPVTSQSIRGLQHFPDLVVDSASPYVSHSPFSPWNPRRSPPLASFPTSTEARRRRASSPAWLEPPQLESEHTAVLRELPGARSAHQPLLPCTIASTPHSPELRRRRERTSGELRRPRHHPPAPLDTGEHGLRPGGLRESSRRL